MKQTTGLLVLVIAVLEIGRGLAGADRVLVVSYGAIALMALIIAGTFLWLWLERATPLALGMAYSWLGAGLFTGWWWIETLTGIPPGGLVPDKGLVAVLALCLVGAVLHFSVIHRSFGWHGASFLWPVVAALGLSTLVYALV